MQKQLLVSRKISVNNFDVIRFLLASAVILCHSFVIYYGNEPFKKTDPFMVLSQEQISLGSVAVNFFFIISGFLIVKSFEYSKTYRQYFSKRILRIYPGFVVAFLLSIFIAGFIAQVKHNSVSDYLQYLHDLHMKKLLMNLVTLQLPPLDYLYFKDLPVGGLNSSLWTIQFEFICYLIVPLLAFLGFFKRNWLFLVAFIAAYLLLFFQGIGYVMPYKNNQSLFLGNPFFFPRFITYFFSGACFYIYRNKIVKTRLLTVAAFACAISSFIWIKCVDQVLPLAGTYLLFYIAYHPRLQFSQFSRKGDYSYGLYLYGWPIQQVVMYFLTSYLNPFRLFFIATPLALACAYASWHLVEKRFVYFRKRKALSIVPMAPFSVVSGSMAK